MDIFLKGKAWQVFLLLVAVPFGFQAVLMSFLVSSDSPNPELILKVMPVIMLVFMGIFLLWFWSLGVGINQRISTEFKPKSKLFKFSIIYSAIYALIFQAFFTLAANESNPGGAMVVILPMHLLGMFCMFYALYFVAKNIATFENEKTVKFSEFSGPFFLLWFFPIGIWLLQPRINRIYTNNT